MSKQYIAKLKPVVGFDMSYFPVILNLIQDRSQNKFGMTPEFEGAIGNRCLFVDVFEKSEHISKVVTADRTQPLHYLNTRPAASLIFSARDFAFAKRTLLL